MKKSINSYQLTIFTVLLVAVFFFVTLHSLPRSPGVDKEKVDVKIALGKIEKGKGQGDQQLVMEGVVMLKEVLKRDKNNIEAIWQLGQLSMESGQFEKAIARFEKFVSLTEGHDKSIGLVSLADAYFFKDDMKKALDALVEAKRYTKEKKVLIEIDERLKIINKI